MTARAKKKLSGWVTVVLILAIALTGILTFPGVWTELTFYWHEHTETELKIKKYAEENGTFYGLYPRSLIDLLERNPETEEFVLNYPFCDDVVAELGTYDTEDGVPLFLQWDRRWGYEIYGSDVIGITGCGPVCLAMVGYYLTGDGETFDPAAVAEFAET